MGVEQKGHQGGMSHAADFAWRDRVTRVVAAARCRPVTREQIVTITSGLPTEPAANRWSQVIQGDNLPRSR